MINVEIKQTQRLYPYLAKYTDDIGHYYITLIVAATHDGYAKGVVLLDPWNLVGGVHIGDFKEHHLELFNGTLTLSNE